jgi:predicted dehydrogenase
MRPRIAIVGAGDVAHRHYLPPLRTLAADVELAAFVDPGGRAGERAVAATRQAWPDVVAVASIDDLPGLGVDAAVDLTPAPLHGQTNRRLLEAGLHVFTEKPMAQSVAEADALIGLARSGERLLLCAPATAVTRRGRWLRELPEAGGHGRPTLVVAHHADPGPAAWREYTGDPRPFYGPGVGPLFDHGVYRLHEMTLLMGPVSRVQAMGSIGVPRRMVRGGPLTGQVIDVTAPDHVLVNLEFERGGLGQLLASFGTPSTRAPWLEIHFPMATYSFGGHSWELDAPVSRYLDDEGPDGTEGWQEGIDVTLDDEGTPEAGVRHFVACLRGEAMPVLTAEHARHVLEVMLLTYESIADGAAHATTTTF